MRRLPRRLCVDLGFLHVQFARMFDFPASTAYNNTKDHGPRLQASTSPVPVYRSPSSSFILGGYSPSKYFSLAMSRSISAVPPLAFVGPKRRPIDPKRVASKGSNCCLQAGNILSKRPT
ncbi:hypothetical protein CPLU01_02968 [Colletotrichum plurivorum]|uniref:Uncharacterized protein n=1 Tax=Colletotrichum plurivorum TaxID=2175906 RepID=A0A8H6KUP1_9PEZI|nr:hypothetical protein CPLU01_02968 [Colletotrichum plurivorum]